MSILCETSLVMDYNNSMERIRKEQEYLNYINNHIKYVKKAYVMYMVPLLSMTAISKLISDEELKDAIEELADIIDTHDASKFSDSEFDGYRAKWYPTKYEQQCDDEYKRRVEERYDDCWKHHYETNDHHPEHWLNHETGISTDMSLRAIIEMLCDWESMSLMFGTSTLEWYENDADDEKSKFTAKTKEIVEDLLYNVLHNSIDKSGK